MGGNTRRFRERFANYVDAQIALSKLKQDHQQTLHSFAQKITETAREAYSEAYYATAIATRQLRDIFINSGANSRSTNSIEHSRKTRFAKTNLQIKRSR